MEVQYFDTIMVRIGNRELRLMQNLNNYFLFHFIVSAQQRKI